jgi:signal transduction histidine kinase
MTSHEWLERSAQRLSLSLTTKLMLGAGFLVGLVALSHGLLASMVTDRRFAELVTENIDASAALTAADLADFYRRRGSWEGLGDWHAPVHWSDALVSGSDVTPAEGSDGVVAAGSASDAVPGVETQPAYTPSPTDEPSLARLKVLARGRPFGPLGLDLEVLEWRAQHSWPAHALVGGQRAVRVVPIEVDGQPVGLVAVRPPFGRPGGLDRRFLTKVNQSLVRTTLLVGLVGFGLSMVLSRQLTRPARELTRAAQRLAAGEWDHRVPVRSRDELGQMSAAFNAMADHLEAQQLARRQLVTDVAHELRTPLSILQAEFEAVTEGLQSPEQAVASAREELNELARLIDDLQLLTSSDAGELRLELQPCQPRELLNPVAERWQAQALKAGVQLVVELGDALPHVQADGARIGQVLGNLIANALRHTPADGVIELSARTTHGVVRFSVRDTGQGIPAEQLPHIFDRFFRADNQPTGARSGHGLGLAIARRLVELHGGEIGADSRPGEGTMVWFDLPPSPALR